MSILYMYTYDYIHVHNTCTYFTLQHHVKTMHSLQYRGIAAVAMNILVLMEVYSCHTATVKGSTIHKFLSLTSTSVAQGEFLENSLIN